MEIQALIESCCKGDTRAQKALYKAFAPRMYAVCLRYARDRDEAQDFLQEGFIKAFTHIGSFNGQGSFEGWLRRIVVRTAIDQLRRQKNIRQQLSIDEPDAMELPDTAISDELSLEYLQRIVQELPAGYRIVFNLFAIEGYSHREIGEQLGITEATSRSQYTRAKAALQRRIYEDNLEKFATVRARAV